MYKFKFILITFCVWFSQNVHSQGKLNVHVLYESLCPDSVKFINQQLYPVWKELSPYINIHFVPFGKSASDPANRTKFVCQHGPQECLGNQIQSCVLHAIQDQDVQVEYVNCFMSAYKKARTNLEEFGQSCSDKIGINWNYVIQCQNSHMGTELQLQAEAITAQIKPKFVPTILYNGQFNQQAQDDSQKNFRGVACALITQVYPEACQSPATLQI